MAMIFVDTGNAEGVCSLAESSACSGLTNSLDSQPSSHTVGGTPGSGTQNISVSGDAVNTADSAYSCIPTAGATWDAGTWTVRMNVTSSNMNLTWKSCHICRVNSSCTNQETIGSNTAVDISLATTGVKSASVTGSAVTPSVGDFVVIVFGYTNGAMTAQSFTRTAGQNIDSPFTAAADIAITGSSGAIKYAGQTPTVFTQNPVNIAGVSGALLYAGQIATVFNSNKVDISAVSGAITYSGQTPTVSRTNDVYITASSGAIVYSGNTATLAQTANQAITAQSGSILYSGNTPTVSSGTVANVDIAGVSGAILYAGNTATLSVTQNQAISALSGAIVYSGNTATVAQTANQSIDALSGAIQYSGNTATLAQTANQSISALSGAITYQGNTAAVVTTAGVVVNALSGAITYTGQTATVQQTDNINIQAVSGQILYGGFPAEVTQSDTVVEVKHGGDDRPRRRRHRGFDLKLWKEQRKPYDDIDRTIEELYAELTGKDSPPEVRQAAQNAVAEYVDTGTPMAPNEPPVFKINWDALITDLRAMEAMRTAHYQREMQFLDEQDMEDLQCL